MAQLTASEFWNAVTGLRRQIAAGARDPAAEALAALACRLAVDDTARRDFLIGFARRHGLTMPQVPTARTLPGVVPGDTVDACGPGAAPARGLSLVTCCRNRTENLLRALPSWLALDGVDEVVVVDWTSDAPVAAALADAGLCDPRILVVRVEDEPRWILTYAFNLGFRVAGFDTILKIDADIVLGRDFLERNPLAPGRFIAGNWRTAPAGQEHLNGFFMIARADLMAVGGFNEFIHSYGWDDEDIYARIEASGLARTDVEVETVHHLPHDDDARTGPSANPAATAADQLARNPHFLIRANRFVANVMPAWSAHLPFLPFRVLEPPAGEAPRCIRVARQGWEPSHVPAPILADARHYAALELLSWHLGRAAMGLDRDRCTRLLRARRWEGLSKLDLEIALGNAPQMLEVPGPRLVIELFEGIPAGSPLDGVIALAERAVGGGLVPVLAGPFAALPQGLPEPLYTLPFVPNWHDMGATAEIALERLCDRVSETLTACGDDMRLRLPAGALASLGARLSAPAVGRRRPVLYIDAQHGMGNRLRAIGSAAAIASRTDRELVIVWQPDHHCDCRFGDLFEYTGPVIDEVFVEDARARRMAVYNYMPIEPGSHKNAEIDLSAPGDIYARSAFVLNAPHSSWESENRFLQALRPVSAVREMIAGVRHPNALAAHVRMEAGQGRDNQSYDRPENWSVEDHALIHHWRAQSHFSRFMDRIDALIAQAQAETLFLAADLPEIYDTFQERYSDRLVFLRRSLYDRSAEQLRYGLADAILLGRAQRMLGSTWSSFSELALRLAPLPVAVEMSGKDF